MATEKKINSRIQQKHDVAANWAKATNFIPKKGEIIIYDAEYNASGEETQPVRFKIGDGSKTVNNLPFAVIDGEQKISGIFNFNTGANYSKSMVSGGKMLLMSTADDPAFFSVGKEDVDDIPSAFGVVSYSDSSFTSTVSVGNGQATEVLLGGETGSAKQVFTSQGSGATPKWTSVVNSLNGNTGDITGIATTSQLDNKQDKITPSNKLSSSLVSDLGAAAEKAVDTVISANSTSTNLPTSKAVEDRINAHSGIDKVGTVTGVKMNGTTKNPASGVVDLGTVLTDASAFATSAQGTKADNALSLDGGTIKKSKTIKMDASVNSDGANLKWGTVNSKNPYIGYATDQNDGTFVVGSLLGTNYASGLAIGGGSGNLLWKGTKVATTNDIPNIVQSTGTSTSSVMSQNATTNAISGKLDKTTYEWNKEFRAGSNGAISLGRYYIYDTQLTFDISSTTNASINGKLVIAAQNGRIAQAKVFGDATGALVSKIVIYQSAIVNNRSWVEVFCNFDGWSKNKVHIYGVALDSATVTNQMSSVTFTNGVPSPITSGDSKWNGTIINDIPTFSFSNGVLTITT